MNWENKELDAMIEKVMAPDSLFTPEVLRSYLRYAYVLGKSDGYTNGVLAMSPRSNKEVA